jgi:hypothetical protein
MTRPELEKGEKLLREIASDRGRYWRDNAVLALVGMVGLGVVLVLIGSPWPAIGALGAPLAIAVRAGYLASEQLGHRWYLTDRRMLLPGGRSVGLMELEKVRRLMGDVQLVTRAGDKHLMRHIAEPAAVVAEIEAARARRAKRRSA